jgi:2-oxoglutarate ferredoxin oxidoreductase subunit gamma
MYGNGTIVHGTHMQVVRFAGSGGQGLMTSGRILALAAGVYEGAVVLQTQSYGPEARGGAARSQVCISDAPINNLNPSRIDVLVSLNQSSCDKYFGDLKDDGTLIIDSSYVNELPTDNGYNFPFTFYCRDKLGNPVVANIMALAYMVAVTEVIERAALEAAVTNNVPQRFVKLNLKALEAGFREGESAKAERRRQNGFIDTQI